MMRKNNYILLFIAAASFFLWSCQNPLDKMSTINTEFVNPAIAIKGLPDTVTVTGYELTVTGDDMDTITETIEAGETSLTFDVPAGDNRTFTLTATSSWVTFEGSVTENLTAGDTIDVTIPLTVVPPIGIWKFTKIPLYAFTDIPDGESGVVDAPYDVMKQFGGTTDSDGDGFVEIDMDGDGAAEEMWVNSYFEITPSRVRIFLELNGTDAGTYDMWTGSPFPDGAGVYYDSDWDGTIDSIGAGTITVEGETHTFIFDGTTLTYTDTAAGETMTAVLSSPSAIADATDISFDFGAQEPSTGQPDVVGVWQLVQQKFPDGTEINFPMDMLQGIEDKDGDGFSEEDFDMDGYEEELWMDQYLEISTERFRSYLEVNATDPGESLWDNTPFPGPGLYYDPDIDPPFSGIDEENNILYLDDGEMPYTIEGDGNDATLTFSIDMGDGTSMTMILDRTDESVLQGAQEIDLTGQWVESAPIFVASPYGEVIPNGAGSFDFSDAIEADGDSDSPATDFAGPEMVFTLANTTDSSITISSLTITEGDTADFDIVTSPSSTIGADDFTTFGIRFDPLYKDDGSGFVAGRAATVTIEHSVTDEGPYTFEVTGTAIAPTLMGYVDDGSGNPVEGAYIRLYGPVGTDPPTVDEYDASKADGYYAFFSIPSGNYYLVIERDGFDPVTHVVTIP